MASLERRVAQLETSVKPVETVIVKTGIPDGCTEVTLSAYGLKEPVGEDLDLALEHLTQRLGFTPSLAILSEP